MANPAAPHRLIFDIVRTLAHHRLELRCLLLINLLGPPILPAAAAIDHIPVQAGASGDSTQCLPDHTAFMSARLNGAINAELSWSGDQLACAGSVRPNARGVRLRFSGLAQDGQHKLVLLFGIAGLKEGAAGQALPANLTIMREGTGEFYATQGDNKCTVDDIRQEPLQGIPLRQRAYRIVARGFCTQPARALNGAGSVLVTRFDFAGRADFYSDDAPESSTSL